MKAILQKIDSVLCRYFGIESEVVTPNVVTSRRGRILISNTSSFKRHCYTQEWSEFASSNLKTVSEENKEKLGIAMGKVIAKKLVISFEKAIVENKKE